MEPKISYKKTAVKMSLAPVIATVLSSVTFKYVQPYGVSPEVYTGSLIAGLIFVKDVLKYRFRLF